MDTSTHPLSWSPFSSGFWLPFKSLVTTASESIKASKSTQRESGSALPEKRPMNLSLPLEVVQEVISPQQIVIIEYFGQLLIRRFQEVLRRKLIVNTSKVSQLLPISFSRGDGH
jgi:hypothetical protein